MTARWENTTFGDVVKFQAGQAFPRAEQGNEKGDYPFIKVSDLTSPKNLINIKEANNWVSAETASKLKLKLIPAGASVFAKIGEGLKAERIRQTVCSTAIDNNMMAAIPFVDKVDSRFVCYGLQYSKLSSFVEGSALPYLRQTDLENIPLLLPPLSEQRRITWLLGGLDDKIESNSRVIAYCKELILTQLDKYLSTNRSSIELSSVLDVRDGTHDSPKLTSEGYYLITSKNLKSFSVLGESDKKISKEAFDDINKRSKVDELDILVSMIGTVGRVSLVLEPSPDYAIKNVGLIKTSKAREYAPFVYAYLASMHGQRSIANCLAGSTQKFLSLTALRKLLLPELTQKELGDFSSFCRPLLDAVLNNQTEMSTLITLRDSLLPELMSGRMQVDEARGLIMNALETEDSHV